MDNFNQTISIKDINYRKDISDSKVLFCVQKSEKLSTAVHRVSEFLSDSEPIKWELRKCSIDILKTIIETYSSSGLGTSLLSRDLDKHFNQMFALCGVALSSGQYSVMNFEIVRQEYLSLRDFLDQNARNQTQNLVTNFRSMEEEKLDKEELIKPLGETENYYKGHMVHMSYGVSNRDFSQVSSRTNYAGEPVSVAGQNIKKEIQPNNVSQRRQELIKLFLRKNGPSSIADIAKTIPDCVEKTVQRELAKLIDMGQVLREGERRWSRYSIPR